MSRILAIFAALPVLLSPISAFSEDSPAPPKDAPVAAASPAPEAKVTLNLKDAKPSEVVESLVKQSKAKILLESTAKAKVTLSLDDAALEPALTAFCKAGKFEWRKLYIGADSKLLEQPDRLAATARLVAGLGFPDLIIAGSSTNKVAMHSEDPKGVKAMEDKLVKDLGLTSVYLITNDAAVAKKDEEHKESPKNVEEYSNGSRKMMDLFMKMTPEEREQALMESLNMMDQVGPGYMSSLMQTLVDANPELLRQMTSRQTQMLFGMDETTRRKLMRLNMESMKYLTPEQIQMLQEDQKAIMQEMQSEGSSPAP